MCAESETLCVCCQTGAGKTHTMQGSDSPSGRGIIPRAVEKVGGGAACRWGGGQVLP